MQDSIQQDLPSYLTSLYETFKILDEDKDDSDLQGESINLNRRRTLFNLYSFTYSDTWQKNLDEFSVPKLLLENVEIKNFLNDYEALIYVENDNYVIYHDSYIGDSVNGEV